MFSSWGRLPIGHVGQVANRLLFPMLEANGLVKIYGSRRVVDGVDFRVQSGEIVGLLGPNGAGKTTSFRMVCGMIVPTPAR